MWSVIKFLGTVFISFIALTEAVGVENPLPVLLLHREFGSFNK